MAISAIIPTMSSTVGDNDFDRRYPYGCEHDRLGQRFAQVLGAASESHAQPSAPPPEDAAASTHSQPDRR